MTTLLIIIIGLLLITMIFTLVFSLIYIFQPEENPLTQRLEDIRDPEGLKKRAKKEKKVVFESIVKLTEPFTRQYYADKTEAQNNIKTLLTEAGKADNEASVWRFLLAQNAVGVIMSAFGFIAMFLMASSNGFFNGLFMGFMGCALGFFMGLFLPKFNLRARAGKRKTEIRYKLPDALDLMVVCVEAGLGLDATIQRVGEESEKLSPEIAYEMNRVTKELNAGVTRTEAFANMGTRTGVDELRSLCNMIIQSDKLGTSISTALRIYADDARTRRRQAAEELAAKASIKMTFPLVLFVFPPLFIVLMGPMVISALGTFFGI